MVEVVTTQPDSLADRSGVGPAHRIAASGLRVTRQRIAVLNSVRPGEHLDVDAITGRAKSELGSVSRQAVYDVLAALTGAGLLRRIEPAGAPTLFEVRVADNHHHLVCRQCGTIADIDCATGTAPCLEPMAEEHAHGFSLDEAEVIWWGRCAACRQSGTATVMAADIS